MAPILPVQTNNYQVFPFFSGTDNGCTNATFVLPPAFTYGNNPNPISFQIPLLWLGGTQQFTAPANDDFAFATQPAPNQNDPASQANTYVSITIKANNMWKCAAAARAQLMQNFTAFLQAVESTLEIPGLLIPGATFRIGQALADWIPAAPVETLFYRYSLSPGFATGTTAYVDVRPGMQLRLDTQISQLISPDSPLNGYVSNDSLRINVAGVPGPNGTRLVGFDPFLSTIKSPAIGVSGSPIMAAGVIDLQPVSSARSYWRLFYPSTMSPASTPGTLDIASNVVLVGAATLADLNAATNSYPAIGSGSSRPPTISFVFFGRAIAVPEIPITVQVGLQSSSLQYVPVGTTIANLAERFTTLPLLPGQQSSLGITVSRRMGGELQNSTTQWLNANVAPYTQNMAAIPAAVWDVPLISGDAVSIS
jgi:hypothetical protein